MKVVMEYIGDLWLHSQMFSEVWVIVSVASRILITFQDKELMVRTETANSSSCLRRVLNTFSRRKHFELSPLLPIDTSYNILRDISTT